MYLDMSPAVYKYLLTQSNIFPEEREFLFCKEDTEVESIYKFDWLLILSIVALTRYILFKIG